MALEPITTFGPTITVSTSEELYAAYEQLAYQEGGGTILLESGYYGKFSYYPYGSTATEEPVIIKSADPENPAEFSGFSLRLVDNLRIENVHVDSTDVDPDDLSIDVYVQHSHNIQFVDSVFTHDADNTLKSTGEQVDTFSYFRDSTDILFEGNLVDGYFHALQATEVDGLEIIDNELTNMQGDGFRGGGLQNVLIEGNYFHDFFGSDQNLTHSDLIQFWGSNADTLTENVTISGNILIASGAASQSIFIRNEEFGDEGDPTSGYFTNFTITDNLIYNAHKWGIHLDNVDGALIDNNTLLWNPDAVMIVGGTEYSYLPEIFARNSINITATDNITSAVILPDGSTESGNQIVTFDNPYEASYVGNHFVNPTAGENVTLEDLYMLPSSPWFGVYGSSIGSAPDDFSDGVTAAITATVDTGDRYDITYDADASFDATGPISDNAGYTYHWTFADGTTAEGISVSKLYDSGGFKGVTLEIRLDGEAVADIARNFAIQTKDIFAFNFEDGVVDISDGVSEVIDNGTTTPSHDGTGFLIGDSNKLELGRDTQGLYEMETFGISLDLTPTGDEPSGMFIELYRTMQGSIDEEGYVSFSLNTSDGSYSLISREPVFDDGGTHRIGIAFNGNTGQLELFADGESVSSVEAWGETLPEEYFNLIFGRTFNDSMDAIIDNAVMSVDPSVAGELALVDPPAEEPPAEEPPAEEPPAEEPPAEEPPAEEPPAEEPPAEEPPAEEPPAEEPPAEEPPAEEPPAEEPPAEEPPAEEEDPRGTPREAVASDDGGNFLSKVFDMFLQMFGLGGKGSKSTETTTEEAAASYDTTLADVVPVTGMLDDDVVASEEEEDEFTDLAA